MSLVDVLKEISACDTEKPYIFVSYSNHDKELVWNDVLEFQKRGYNIWLDEKNLDKTKASWKDDALTAIEDMYCMLVVFYVSKSSLISEACYRELSKTTDELTQALHYGPVKFIAIDVDEVGNIVDFTRVLHQSVVQDTNLTKDVKASKLFTLHHFMKDFFDSNNEKVRVHPKNEANRKMNYYEEIVASFPDEARLFIPDVEEEVSVPANTEVQDKQAEEIRALKEMVEKLQAQNVQADEENLKKTRQELVKTLKEKVQKEESAKQKNTEPVIEEEESEEGLVIDDPDLLREIENRIQSKQQQKRTVERVMTRNQLEAALEVSRKETTSSAKFLSVAKVTEKQIQNAIRAYAKDVRLEQVYALMDCTLFGSAKEGFLVTKEGVYSSYFKNAEKMIPFGRLKKFENTSVEYRLRIYYIDGAEETVFIPSVYKKAIETLLTEVAKI